MQNLKRTAGSTTIKLLKNNDSVTFSTNEIMLQNISSAYYDDFWRGQSALRGIWIRGFYVGGADGRPNSPWTRRDLLRHSETFDPPPKK